jgi:cytochrome P450
MSIELPTIFTEDSLIDPFPLYHAIREKHPVCEIDPGGIWAVSRYQDVKFALQHHNIFSSTDNLQILQPDWLKNDYLPRYMLAEEPPVYNYHRSIILRAFLEEAINDLEVPIKETAASLIASIKKHKFPELLSDFSYPYFGKITQLLTGINNETLQCAHNWIVLFFSLPEDPSKQLINHIEKTYNLFQEELIKSVSPSIKPKCILQALLIDAQKDRTLTMKEACSALELVIFSVYSLPINSMSHLYINLAKQTGVKISLKENDTLIPCFIEESLRFNSSAHILTKKTKIAIELSGTVIPPDAVVYLMIASANRDPEKFKNPDVFDIHRDNHAHLGFGYGVHHCLGMKLFRIASRVAIKMFTSAFETIDCPEINTLHWSHSPISHHVDEIPMIVK